MKKVFDIFEGLYCFPPPLDPRAWAEELALGMVRSHNVEVTALWPAAGEFNLAAKYPGEIFSPEVPGWVRQELGLLELTRVNFRPTGLSRSGETESSWTFRGEVIVAMGQRQVILRIEEGYFSSTTAHFSIYRGVRELPVAA